jgi:hypothetical protein
LTDIRIRTDIDSIHDSETTTRRKHNQKTPSDTTGTIPRDGASFIDFNSFLNILQISDIESEEILVYFNIFYFTYNICSDMTGERS